MTINRHILTSYIPSVLFACIVIFSCCTASNEYIDKSLAPKWITFATGTGILLTYSVVFNIIHAKQIKFAYNTVLPVIGLLLILSYLISRSTSFYDVMIFMIFCLFIAECRILNNTINLLSTTVISLIISAIYSSVIAVNQLIQNVEMTGCYDNPVGFCETLVVGALSIIYLAKHFFSARLIFQLLAIILFADFTILLFLSESRTSLIALTVGLCFLLRPRRSICLIIIPVLLSTLLLLTLKKSDSTLGREFIIKTSLSLLNSKESILFGYGEDGFIKNYMPKQAILLLSESEETRQRADNIIHPLNEFLLLTIKYGVVFILCLLAALVSILRKASLTNYTYAMLAILIVFALLSYPLRYPISWIILGITLASNYPKSSNTEGVNHINIPLMILVLNIATLLIVFKTDSDLKLWKTAHMNSMLGKTNVALSQYKNVSDHLHSPEFVYNYASFLYHNGMYRNAQKIIRRSPSADYETTLLSGQINKATGLYEEAIVDFNRATNMCPNRFYPIYELYETYKLLNNTDQQTKYYNILISKKIKIKSQHIDNILKNIQHDISY